MEHIETIVDFLKMTEESVLDKFASLPNSQWITQHNAYRYSNVYVPGTRKDRVLLVAHADTFDDSKGDIAINNGEIISARIFDGRKKYFPERIIEGSDKKMVPLGADDRAGCAILWLLRHLGHSLLITNSEEIGCIGAISASAQQAIAQELNEHSYAIEFDRRGHRNCVFYDVGTLAFKEWFSNQWRYRIGEGSISDISYICHDMCGVNVSVGYYGEHSKMERLVYWQWEHTLNTARHQLTKEQRSWRLFN